jgi:hypothetical protein
MTDILHILFGIIFTYENAGFLFVCGVFSWLGYADISISVPGLQWLRSGTSDL